MNERPHLLIVDDEPINIQALYQLFRDDCVVFMATSAGQALACCQKAPLPDLILLDVLMPGIGGHELCRQLKADPVTADIPIIFITAQLEPEDETRALEAGAVDFISKPVNPAVVRARVRTHLTLKAQADQLRSLAYLDGLTGVANRRRFEDALQVEWRACRRAGQPLSLLMIDVDHFKQFNDHYGHLAGDGCLQRVAATIGTQAFRAHDLAARYGGEEFACLLPGMEQGDCQSKAEALCRAIEQLAIPHALSATAAVVTVSIGVATLLPDDTSEPACLVGAADAALYQAKTTGRNRVCVR